MLCFFLLSLFLGMAILGRDFAEAERPPVTEYGMQVPVAEQGRAPTPVETAASIGEGSTFGA